MYLNKIKIDLPQLLRRPCQQNAGSPPGSPRLQSVSDWAGSSDVRIGGSGGWFLGVPMLCKGIALNCSAITYFQLPF